MVIEHIHIIKARQMVQKIYEFSEALIVLGSETTETKAINEVAQYLSKKRWVGHSEAMRYFRHKRGMLTDDFKKVIRHLQAEGSVSVGEIKNKRGRNGLAYVWTGSVVRDVDDKTQKET